MKFGFIALLAIALMFVSVVAADGFAIVEGNMLSNAIEFGYVLPTGETPEETEAIQEYEWTLRYNQTAIRLNEAQARLDAGEDTWPLSFSEGSWSWTGPTEDWAVLCLLNWGYASVNGTTIACGEQPVISSDEPCAGFAPFMTTKIVMATRDYVTYFPWLVVEIFGLTADSTMTAVVNGTGGYTLFVYLPTTLIGFDPTDVFTITVTCGDESVTLSYP